MKIVRSYKYSKDSGMLKERNDLVKRIEDVRNPEIVEKNIHLGIIGSCEAAAQFMKEVKYVDGIEAVGVCDPETIGCGNDLKEFLNDCNAVYIENNAQSMDKMLRFMLRQKQNVLFDAENGLDPESLRALYDEAEENSLVLLEAIKTAYFPAFLHLIDQLKSKKIGEVRDISLSLEDLSPNALLPIIKLLGDRYQGLNFYIVSNGESLCSRKADMLVRGVMQYGNALATFHAGRGVKLDGSLIICGTTGYARVPEPWWKTESFELRFEDDSRAEKHFFKLQGNGFRYVIQEFVRLIRSETIVSDKLPPQESVATHSIIKKFRLEKGYRYSEQ